MKKNKNKKDPVTRSVVTWVNSDPDVKFENGEIVTRLADLDFFILVLKSWGEYPENEIGSLIDDAVHYGETTELYLMRHGFGILQNMGCVEGELIYLIKLGHGAWMIQDYSDLEMSQFVHDLC